MDSKGRKGRRAEGVAARFLRRRGLKILARNVRCGRQEIDILAREGTLLVVVEVRFRGAGLLAANQSVDGHKVESLRRACVRLLADHQLPPRTPVRFDLVLLGPTGAPQHLPGAILGHAFHR